VFDTRAPVAAGSGLILEHSDGVTALDGRTGEERWRYRRPGAERIAVWGNPAGTWVLVALAPGGDPDGAITRYVGLDGDSGEVGFELERRPGAGWRGIDLRAGPGWFVMGLTDHTLVLLDESEATLVGVDLQTARPRWRWRSPDGCDFALDDYSRAADSLMPAADSVVLSGHCADDAVTVGLDDRTGSEGWRHTFPEEEHGQGDVEIDMGTRRDAALLNWHNRDYASLRVMVDTATGAELVPGSADIDGSRPHLRLSDSALTYGVGADGNGGGRSLTYRVVEAGGRSADVTFPDCGTVHPTGVEVVQRVVVAVCSGADYETPPAEMEPTVRVVPLDEPGSAQVIEIDPDTGLDADTSQPILNDPPGLLALPGVLLVAWDDGTRITALE
jgi:hypothetical protein